MPKVKNAVWRFFASVKLALISLIILAATSIIGTIIKQGEAPSYYVREYGPALSRFLELLDLNNMYKSWWFIVLICFFAVNIVVCSIERLPNAWRLVTLDNLSIDSQKLAKMSFTQRLTANLSLDKSAGQLRQLLIQAGWKNPRRQDRQEAILLFAQKGAWTRLAVYVVHLSVLVILIGAMTGAFFGYQAYVFLPEGRTTGNIYLQGTKTPIPLGFKLRCDRFERTLYDNGMVKEFRADLTVIDPKRQTPYHKSIIVNDPLTYHGLTFYQADSFPMQEFTVEIRNLTTGRQQAFRIPPEQDVVSQETGGSLRIVDVKADQDGTAEQAKISFSAEDAGAPRSFWLANKGTFNLRQAGMEYTISIRQDFSTLLLVTKDPGIPIVYLGCLMMLMALAVCFFLTHRRVWLMIIPGNAPAESLILASGTSNKNRPAFARQFQELINHLEQIAA